MSGLETIDPDLQAEIQSFANHAARRARSADDLIYAIERYAEQLLGESVTVRLDDDGKLLIRVPLAKRGHLG
jgi:hypothetical protein